MGQPGWPFGAGFDFNEVMRMLQSPGPVNWEIARKIAIETSTNNTATRNMAVPMTLI